jgi:hypothetical protein
MRTIRDDLERDAMNGRVSMYVECIYAVCGGVLCGS